MAISWVPILGKDQAIGIGFDILPSLADRIVSTLPTSTYAIVTDLVLEKLHLPALIASLEQALLRADKQTKIITYSVPQGEGSKSRKGKASVEDFLFAQKCTRDTVLLALGGGVVGDLSGFVSATFMRGIRYVQIPTTLLAMVDSAVGGKTAIDVPAGKNLVGAFCQPEYTFINLSFLQTLPEREFANGMAEVVKTAAIWDLDAFDMLEAGVEKIRASVLDSEAASEAGRDLLFQVVKSSVAVKAFIVTKDEKETGLRNLVNFGHTIGHAIEAVLTPQLLHGEAVSVGMILEAEIARSLGVLNNSAVGRLTRCLKSYNLPIAMDEAKLKSCPNYYEMNTDRLMDIMKLDKKNAGSTKKIVLLAKIGKTYEEKATGVDDQVIRNVLSSSVKVFPGPPSMQTVSIVTPGSKSISNRALILAALGKGTCRLTNLLHSDDTQVMITALEKMQGAQFTWQDDGETLVVQGGAGHLCPPAKGEELYLGNAGTAARFLTTVCTLARPPSSSKAATCITGNRRMKERPIGPLVEALRSNAAEIEYRGSQGCLPLAIAATGLRGGHIQLAANISSQYVSSILLAAPYANEEILLELVGEQVISQPYIDMTCAMMKEFGVQVHRVAGSDGSLLNQYRIPKCAYTNPPEYSIESDASSATYPLALAAINGCTCTLTNIGSSSLQGDARFAKDVLAPMGCQVTQTASSTTVTGPPVGCLKALGRIDMEPMTDAFMTAAVLAAVAVDSTQAQSTQIVGIANQRVKECNRILAMQTELGKLGIKTVELSDGIEIFGKPASSLCKDADIHCYDDHRIAMSMSVLSTVASGPGATIQQRRCVGKTWPSWFDDMQRQLGYRIQGAEEIRPPVEATKTHFDADASIILVGMRGSGKTHVGRIAAKGLQWSFIDADDYFENKTSKTPRQFVEQHGWPAFRSTELNMLHDILKQAGSRHVIALGGGIIETPEALAVLQEYSQYSGPVVNIVRDIEEVEAYLNKDTARPKYGEAIRDVAARRAPLLASCSSYEFVSYVQVQGTVNGTNGYIVDQSQKLQTQTEEQSLHIDQFFHRLAHRSQSIDPSKRSYFLSLTFPNLLEAAGKLQTVTIGADAVELRVDLLDDPNAIGGIPSQKFVGKQLAVLRKYCTLPVIFTVRTKAQGGRFPDSASTEYSGLVEAAIRWGCEFVDVEKEANKSLLAPILARKGQTQIIASHHDWSGSLSWSDSVMQSHFDEAARFGDIIKLVSKANSMQDNFDMMAFRDAQTKIRPLITLNMGQTGQLSRILNPFFSPITHPLLAAAAPGQLSFAQIQQALYLIGELPAKRFYLFGKPITHSKSPLIHNTAFRELGLPHKYRLHESSLVDQSVVSLIRTNAFGGASVTIPHKLDIIPLLDDLTPEAKVIGAVNTIIPVQNGDEVRLLGTNTDWIGMRNLLVKSLPVIGPETAGLVIGAGGTARAAIYAFHSLGFPQILLFNRTRANADKLAKALPQINITVIDSLSSLSVQPVAIISTIPADGTAAAGTLHSDVSVVLPHALLAASGGVVIDMAYKPYETPLLGLARQHTGWTVYPGIRVLLEQAFEQFRLWTGKEPPRTLITDVVLREYLAEQR